jgi:uncharacterized membrane protein
MPGWSEEVIALLNAVRSQTRWKTNESAQYHLEKRRRRGHLPSTATLKEYENIITTAVHQETAKVYRYWYQQIAYVTVVAKIEKQDWLVMIGPNGVLETAFVVERPERYLQKPGFEYLGRLSEVNNELG